MLAVRKILVAYPDNPLAEAEPNGKYRDGDFQFP